jgi:hypothetical protein
MSWPSWKLLRFFSLNLHRWHRGPLSTVVTYLASSRSWTLLWLESPAKGNPEKHVRVNIQKRSRPCAAAISHKAIALIRSCRGGHGASVARSLLRHLSVVCNSRPRFFPVCFLSHRRALHRLRAISADVISLGELAVFPSIFPCSSCSERGRRQPVRCRCGRACCCLTPARASLARRCAAIGRPAGRALESLPCLQQQPRWPWARTFGHATVEDEVIIVLPLVH